MKVSAFTQAFFVASLRANTSSTNGSGRAARTISTGVRPPIVIVTFVFSPPSNTLAISVEDGSAARGTGEPSNSTCRISRSASRLIPWNRLSIESRIWRPFGSLAGTKRVV